MLTCPFRSTLLAVTIALGSAPAIAQSSKPTAAVQREVCAAAFQKLLNKPYIFVRSATVDGHEAHQFRSPNGVYANTCYLTGHSASWKASDALLTARQPRRWGPGGVDDLERVGDRGELGLNGGDPLGTNSTFSGDG